MQIHLIYYLGFLWDVVVHVFYAGTACCVYIIHISICRYVMYRLWLGLKGGLAPSFRRERKFCFFVLRDLKDEGRKR